MAALVQLAEQAIRMGIDYHTLGLGWGHPTTRTEYRQAQHPSTTCPASRQRAEASRARLVDTVAAVANGDMDIEKAVTSMFLREIGLQAGSPAVEHATFAGVAAALEAELLLPLRALHEGQPFMQRTYKGEPVPPRALAEALQAITRAVLSRPGGFAEWRYGNAVGLEQLRGLSGSQAASWRSPSYLRHPRGLRTHEDAEGELGLFWATKIGGPSHGFDFEAQCLLPLLANARHKVLLVSDDVAWPAHPVGRAHFRLLWTAPVGGAFPTPSEPRLWLEPVHCDFGAMAAGAVDHAATVQATLRHAVEKAETMQVPLSVDPLLYGPLQVLLSEHGPGGGVVQTRERYVLRPSNGVCEASDHLSSKHDWVQLREEVTEPLLRVVLAPAGCRV